jgi:hypothetical protein
VVLPLKLYDRCQPRRIRDDYRTQPPALPKPPGDRGESDRVLMPVPGPVPHLRRLAPLAVGEHRTGIVLPPPTCANAAAAAADGRLDLVVPVRQNQNQWQVLSSPDEEPQHIESRLIGPAHILDREHR